MHITTAIGEMAHDKQNYIYPQWVASALVVATLTNSSNLSSTVQGCDSEESASDLE